MAKNLIQVSGGKSFAKTALMIKKMDTNISKAIVDTLELTGKYAERELKENTPVDTGKLQRSIGILSFNMVQGRIVVGPDPATAPYAKWVEYGHHLKNGKFLSGQYFVQKTKIQISDDVIKFFNSAILKAVDKAY